MKNHRLGAPAGRGHIARAQIAPALSDNVKGVGGMDYSGKLELRKISELSLAAAGLRKHPEKQLSALAASLKKKT